MSKNIIERENIHKVVEKALPDAQRDLLEKLRRVAIEGPRVPGGSKGGRKRRVRFGK